MPAGSRVMRSKDCSNARSASVFGRLVQNRSFLTVVEKGSLHRAAARLRISQPALSRQIQALEHESGGRFLERMATGVSPAAGGQTLPRGWALCWRPLIWPSTIPGELYVGRHQVRIACVPSVQRYLGRPLREVRRSHPQTVLKLMASRSYRVNV